MRARPLAGDAAVTADQARLPDEAGQRSPDEADRYSRAALSILTEPGDAVLGALLRSVPPKEILDIVMSECPDPASVLGRVREGDGGPGAEKNSGGIVSRAVADCAIERWRARRRDVPPPGRLELWEKAGVSIAFPGEPPRPAQCHKLVDAKPVAIWVS